VITRWQWAVMHADLDPVVGSEQGGTRPVLIVSNEGFNQAIPNVTVLPLTSTRRRLYPSEVLLPRGVAGQPLETIVLAHQVRTIAKQRLGGVIGYLDDATLRQAVLEAITRHFDLL